MLLGVSSPAAAAIFSHRNVTKRFRRHITFIVTFAFTFAQSPQAQRAINKVLETNLYAQCESEDYTGDNHYK